MNISSDVFIWGCLRNSYSACLVPKSLWASSVQILKWGKFTFDSLNSWSRGFSGHTLAHRTYDLQILTNKDLRTIIKSNIVIHRHAQKSKTAKITISQFFSLRKALFQQCWRFIESDDPNVELNFQTYPLKFKLLKINALLCFISGIIRIITSKTCDKIRTNAEHFFLWMIKVTLWIIK